MSNNYDNWARLVRAVLLREQFRELSLLSSLSSSSSRSASFTFALNSQQGSELPADVSNTMIDHREWNRMLPLDNQRSAWKSTSMRVFLDKKSGKNCVMLGARRLVFSQYSYVEWIRYHPNSRFTETAKINSSYMFLRGGIKRQLLSPDTIYAAYLVFRLTKGATVTGRSFGSAMAASRLAEGGKPGGRLMLRPKDSKEALAINIQPGKEKKGVVAARRDDGWLELEIRIGRGDNGEVEARLLKIDRTRGLIVEGIEFRPKTPGDTKGKTKRIVKGFFSRSKCENVSRGSSDDKQKWTYCGPCRDDR